MRLRLILSSLAACLLLVGCTQEKTIGTNEKKLPVVSKTESIAKSVNEVMPSTEQMFEQVPAEYVALNESDLSIEDSDVAYEMCVHALTNYYQAVWNGTDIELDAFIENKNLKQYTLKKVHSQNTLHGTSDPVKAIEVGEWEVAYTNDEEGGYLYFYMPVEITKYIGGYGEVTELLVRNVDGKLAIVDWYTGGKDTYDFLVRGDNQTIDNPDIWNDDEWVEKVTTNQNEFSGSTQ